MRLNNNAVRAYTVALLMALSLGAPIAAKGSAADVASTAPVVDISKIHIDNFGRVDSTYFRAMRIPIVLVSSKSGESDKFWGLQQGADGYVIKPFTGEELVTEVQRVIG